MKQKIINFCNFLKTDKAKKYIAIFAFLSLLIYFVIGISAYASWFPGSTKFFVYNSSSGLIFRILTSGLVILSGIFVLISYRDKINWKWWLILPIWLLVSLLMVFVTTREYYVLYRGQTLYDFMTEQNQYVSLATMLKMFFSFGIDILFGFLLFFAFPKTLGKKHFLIIGLLFLLIILYSCFYSLVKDRSYFIYFFKGDWKYTAESIGSIFGNKQQWGIFLASVFPIAAISIWIIHNIKINKVLKISLYLFCLLVVFLSMFCGLVAYCKTTIVCNVLFVFVFFVGLIIYLYRKKIYFWATISTLLIASVGVFVLLLFKIPALQSKPILSFVFKMLDTLFKRGEVGADQRLLVIVRVLENFPSENLFFGIPKGAVDTAVRQMIPELQDHLHTGFIIFFARSGLFGVIIYIIFLGLLFIRYSKMIRFQPILAILSFGLFATAFILDLSELEILLFSSSINVFILSLFGIGFVSAELEKCGGNYENEII